MSTNMNGDVAKRQKHSDNHSQTIDHVKSYPLVADLSSEVQKNSVGAKSISTFNYLYANLAEPVFPYFRTPYSIIKPYLQRADSIGDSSLNTVDEKFPAVKNTNLDKLKTTAFDVFNYPFKVAGQGKGYVFSTYNDEYEKVAGDGIFAYGKAIVSTELRIAADALHAVGNYLGPKKDEAMNEYEKTKRAGEARYEKTKKAAHEKKDQIVNSTKAD
ncbi:MAG: hypothetical protein M1831_005535 [Alyxoria varia]|nr:MAG: hypothetical protein M1831_005535 [Alyxoria varia]